MKPRLITVLISLLCYLISLFCGIFILEKAGPTTFILGLVCLFFGWGYLAWYANPVLLGSVIAYLLKRDWIAFVLAVVALALGLTTLGIDEMPRNEGGEKERVVGYQIGFYLWLASMAVILISSLIMGIRGKPPVGRGPESGG
jgi:hypothetical protein